MKSLTPEDAKDLGSGSHCKFNAINFKRGEQK